MGVIAGAAPHVRFASLDRAEVGSRSVEYGASEGGVRPSVARFELKFGAFGNAVSLFPKEKYPAARGRDGGNSQLLFLVGVPRASVHFLSTIRSLPRPSHFAL